MFFFPPFVFRWCGWWFGDEVGGAKAGREVTGLRWEGVEDRDCVLYLRLFQHTELEHTPKRNLYQQAF